MSIVFAYGVFSLMLVFTQAISTDRYTRTFTYLAAGFVLLFFLIPLFIASETGSLRLGAAYFRFSSSAIYNAGNALILFSMGFAAAGWMLKFRSKRKPGRSADLPYQGSGIRPSSSGPEGRIFVEVIVAIILVALAVYAFYQGLYEETIAIRRQEQQASYIFATFLISTYYLGCFYILKALGQGRVLKAAFWVILSAVISVNFVGRALILLIFALPVIHYVRRPELSFALIVAAVAVFLPVIASGKQLIYTIMTGGDIIGAISDAYTYGTSLFDLFGDISHLVVSYDYAPVLVQHFGGFRYFWDIPQGFIFYLRLLGMDTADSLTYFNTEAIFLVRQSIVPPGYLAFGYVEAGYPGIVIAGMIFRLIGYWVGLLRARIGEGSLSADFYFAFIAANTFYIGEPRTLVLTTAFPCLIIYLLSSISQKRSDAVQGASRVTMTA